MLDLLRVQPSPQAVLDDPVDLQIRIPADGGCEVSIIVGCQSEMSGILRAVPGLLHGAQGQPADQRLLSASLYFCQQLLDLLGPDFILPHMHGVAEIIDEDGQRPDLLADPAASWVR